jgi:thiol-disulfide isomerase/thioredoxin
MNRRALLLTAPIAALAPALLAVRPAHAEARAFDPAAFDAAQAAGKPILVEITAPWCPVCAKQRPVLGALEQKPAFKDLVVFNIDFDSQKDLVSKMGARMQSTLIVFHGREERGRSTGVSDPAAIEALLARATA